KLYFYADGRGFKAPDRYTVQVWANGQWTEVAHARTLPRAPLANGENVVSFSPVMTTKLRVLLAHQPSAPVALVELKAFK
ncbi:MAG TPA: hypothetical protein VFV81_02515, partial [Verrucomicrobiae bacterium]|nr:hypothetical protein [Verrucomicrobiae bacterium]